MSLRVFDRRLVLAALEVITPPAGATTSTLPNGVVSQNINGTVYFTSGGAYYRPIYMR
jgi:hypothetical protein